MVPSARPQYCACHWEPTVICAPLGDIKCHLAANAVLVFGTVSNFNSKVPRGSIYPHIKFERDPLNIFEFMFTLSGSTCGHGDVKAIISHTMKKTTSRICYLFPKQKNLENKSPEESYKRVH